MLYSRRYSLFIALLVCVFSIHGQFTINNVGVDTLAKVGEWIGYTITEGQGVRLSVDGSNLDLSTVALNDPAGLTASYDDILKKSIQISSGALLQMRAGGNITIGGRLQGAKAIFYESREGIEVNNSVLRTNSISLMSKIIKLHECYIDAYTLELESNDPSSMIQVIRVVFDLSSTIPHLIDGEIDFSNGRIDNLFIIGVKKIELLLRPHAFQRIVSVPAITIVPATEIHYVHKTETITIAPIMQIIHSQGMLDKTLSEEGQKYYKKNEERLTPKIAALTTLISEEMEPEAIKGLNVVLNHLGLKSLTPVTLCEKDPEVMEELKILVVALDLLSLFIKENTQCEASSLSEEVEREAFCAYNHFPSIKQLMSFDELKLMGLFLKSNFEIAGEEYAALQRQYVHFLEKISAT